MKKTSRLLALLILAASSHALAEGTSVSYNGQRVSLVANKAPINTVKNPDAIAQTARGASLCGAGRLYRSRGGAELSAADGVFR